jgi:hypothetical protein
LENILFHKTFNFIQKILKVIPYNVKICTGDISRAGTDSSVTIKFFGTKGNSSDIFIEKIENRFDRGSEDDLMVLI